MLLTMHAGWFLPCLHLESCFEGSKPGVAASPSASPLPCSLPPAPRDVVCSSPPALRHLPNSPVFDVIRKLWSFLCCAPLKVTNLKGDPGTEGGALLVPLSQPEAFSPILRSLFL